MMNMGEAEKIAQTLFKERYADRDFSEAIAERLSVGSYRDGGQWRFEIDLLPDAPEAKVFGLLKDLEYPPAECLVTIGVDAETGEAELTELGPLPW